MFFIKNDTEKKSDKAKTYFIPLVEKVKMEHDHHFHHVWCLAKSPNVFRHFYCSPLTWEETRKSGYFMWYKVILNPGEQTMLKRIDSEEQDVFQAALAFDACDIASCIIVFEHGMQEYPNPYGCYSSSVAECPTVFEQKL